MKQAISLVLSSGGARGLAHIGVIEELKRQGFEIKSIAGTSMGALVGGVYATGYMEEYKNWLSSLDKLDVFKMIDFTISTQGLVKGDKIFKVMKEMVPDTNIEDMNIPYVASAVDIISHKELVFDKGNLFEAVRASISIPTVFTPVKKGKLRLVDGGVLNPVPINRVKRFGDDLLVVVNVNAHVPCVKPTSLIKEEKKNWIIYNKKVKSFQSRLADLFPKDKEKLSYFNLLSDTISIMGNQISMLTIEKYKPDILINISRESCGTYDFYKATEMIEIGRYVTEKSLMKFKMNNQSIQ
jgi:NTE family protein